MTVRIEKPAINVREELADLRKPSGVAGEAMLRAETPQEQFNLIGAGRRNILINGAMQVAQRGTSFTSVSAGTFTLDRWKIEGGNYAAAFNISQDADAPTGLTHCLKLDVTTADTSTASNEYSYLHYLVEGYDAAAAGFGNADGKPVTISFWHKHTAAGEYSVSIRNADSTRSIVGAYYQKTSDTWEYSTITFAPCPDGTWTTASDRGFRIGFAITMGSLYHASEGVWNSSTKLSTANQVNAFADTANNFRITGVQLELGKVATPFEHRSYGEELALCQRYFERKHYDYGALLNTTNWTSTDAYGGLEYITKRATPAATVSSVSDFNHYGGGTARAVTGLVVQSEGVQAGTIRVVTGGTLTLYQSSWVEAKTNGGYFDIDAEL